MLKTLLKKQLLSALYGFGKNKSQKSNGAFKYLIGVLLIVLILGFYFFMISLLLLPILLEEDLGWVYFALMSFIASTFAVIGGVFMAQSQLYQAKDNELLLSMPIPTKYILFCRMVPLYLQNLLFEASIMIPAIIVWAIYQTVTIHVVIFWLILILTKPFISLVITCLLGFVISALTSKMKHKSLITIILSIAFLGVYFVFISLGNNFSEQLIDKIITIGANGISYIYTLYMASLALTGDVLGFLFTIVLRAILFGGLYFVLSKTYLKIITRQPGTPEYKKAKYNSKSSKPLFALFKKEVKLFFSLPAYCLNCGLGALVSLILSVLLVVKFNELNNALATFLESKDILAIYVCLVICFICSMDATTAPSISLEGNNIWIAKSLPVDTMTVFKSKILLHYVVTAPFAQLAILVFAILFKLDILLSIFLLIIPSMITIVCGEIGLIFNLKRPNLDWENPTMVVKQSFSVLLTLLSSLGIIIVLAVLYFLTKNYISIRLYFLFSVILLGIVIYLLITWLKTKGTKLFEGL